MIVPHHSNRMRLFCQQVRLALDVSIYRMSAFAVAFGVKADIGQAPKVFESTSFNFRISGKLTPFNSRDPANIGRTTIRYSSSRSCSISWEGILTRPLRLCWQAGSDADGDGRKQRYAECT